jgi:cytochrome P450
MDQPEAPRFPFPAAPDPYDPPPTARELNARCPVTKVTLPNDTSAWLVTGFDEAREVLTGQQYSRALVYAPGRTVYGVEATAAGSISAMDPPEHTQYRRLPAGALTDRRVQALRPRVAEIVDDAIDAMLAGPRPADLSAAFSRIVPAKVICLLLGVPVADIGTFSEWSNAMFGDWNRPPERIAQAQAALGAYMAELIARKRLAPEDDLIGVLTGAYDAGGTLTEEELVKFCFALLGAGYETTASMISLSFLALCRHPGELDRLRADPDLIPAAVEELLRYIDINGSGWVPFSRITREEVTLGGVTIPAGEAVLPYIQAANRDPAAFDDPDRLDLGRPSRPHLGFSAGAHYCMGAPLARVELQEAFRGLLTRLPGLRMAVPVSDLEFREGQAITSMRELPVTWDDAPDGRTAAKS